MRIENQPLSSRLLPVMEMLGQRVLMSASPSLVTQTNLVSDGGTGSASAAHTDPNLINPWGTSIGADGYLWVSNNNSGTSTFYNSSGTPESFYIVNIPQPSGATGPAGPTGIIANTTSGFQVSESGRTGPSNFIYVTEQGIVAGWSDSVNSTNAITAVDDSAVGAVFKGATSIPAASGTGRVLLVADFGRDKIVELDSNFSPIGHAGLFVDHSIPAGYAPFNIKRMNGDVYVTYAKQDAEKQNDVPGLGNGYVDVYSQGGVLLSRLASGSVLDSPWGLAIAPPTYGSLAGDILVGNFGNGRINAFTPAGVFQGKVLGTSGTPLVISGLWALTEGTTSFGGVNTLFFTAGTNNQLDGLLGTLTA